MSAKSAPTGDRSTKADVEKSGIEKELGGSSDADTGGDGMLEGSLKSC